MRLLLLASKDQGNRRFVGNQADGPGIRSSLRHGVENQRARRVVSGFSPRIQNGAHAVRDGEEKLGAHARGAEIAEEAGAEGGN